MGCPSISLQMSEKYILKRRKEEKREIKEKQTEEKEEMKKETNFEEQDLEHTARTAELDKARKKQNDPQKSVTICKEQRT